MRTDDQKNASRVNGAKSNGPTTEQGKAASARNGNRHNLSSTGHVVLLSTEDSAQFERLREAYVLRFQPVDAVEMDVVEGLFAASWREQRIAKMEAALMELEIANQREDIEEDYDEMNEETRQTLAFLGTANKKLGSALLMRYAGAARRAYAGAFRILRDLQGDRFNRQPAVPAQQDRDRQAAETRAPTPRSAAGNEKLPSEPDTPSATLTNAFNDRHHRYPATAEQTAHSVCPDTSSSNHEPNATQCD